MCLYSSSYSVECDGETNPSFTAGAAQSRDQVNPFHRCNIGLHFPEGLQHPHGFLTVSYNFICPYNIHVPH